MTASDDTDSVSDTFDIVVSAAPDTTAPTVSSAAVDGASLVITFSETLAAAANLANSAFTVKKTPRNGSEETVDLSTTQAPSITDDTVTLTLAAAVVSTDTVTVGYAKPGTAATTRSRTPPTTR